MPARTKGRAKFDFRGRAFVWWVDGDCYLRIASADKKFVIAFPLGGSGPPAVAVIGQEFLGVEPAVPHPVWLQLYPPWPAGESMGAWVDELLRWSFDPAHSLTRLDAPPQLL
jgi:hypothetical protein